RVDLLERHWLRILRLQGQVGPGNELREAIVAAGPFDLSPEPTDRAPKDAARLGDTVDERHQRLDTWAKPPECQSGCLEQVGLRLHFSPYHTHPEAIGLSICAETRSEEHTSELQSR